MRLSEEELAEVLKNKDLKLEEEMSSDNDTVETNATLDKIARVEELMIKRALDKRAKPQHKYHAQRSEYNGIRYASKKEAEFARQLDLRQQAGEIDFWLRQIPFALPGGIIYRLDFATFKAMTASSAYSVYLQINAMFYDIHWIEIKGYDTPVGKLKRKQCETLYHIQIGVV